MAPATAKATGVAKALPAVSDATVPALKRAKPAAPAASEPTAKRAWGRPRWDARLQTYRDVTSSQRIHAFFKAAPATAISSATLREDVLQAPSGSVADTASATSAAEAPLTGVAKEEDRDIGLSMSKREPGGGPLTQQ